jgi:hypothetical protein
VSKHENCVTVRGWISLLVAWGLVSAVGLAASLAYTNPSAIGPAGVTLWFVVLFASLSSWFSVGLYLSKRFMHLHATGVSRLRYSWRQGLLLSGWGTGLLALSSLRQLSILDAILLGLLLVIVEVYVRFRWP